MPPSGSSAKPRPSTTTQEAIIGSLDELLGPAPKLASPQPPSTPPSIRQLQEGIAKQLDLLNDMLNVAEERLRSLKPLGATWHWYNHDDGGGTDVLGVAKLDNKWRLVHAYDHDGNEGAPSNITPLVECSAEVRLAAVPEIPKLRDVIHIKKGEFLEKINQTLAELQKWLGEVK